MSRSSLKWLAFAAAVLLGMGIAAGCARQRPAILGDYALPTPTVEPTPEPTPTPTPTPEPEPTISAAPVFDAFGRYVSSPLHYSQYITFEMIQVYEQAEDTFLDAVAINSYPEALVCAVDVQFFDEDGAQIGFSQLQTRDGQYVLVLAPGENTLFARIDTDIVLTDKQLSLAFDEALGVTPDTVTN